MPAQTFLHAGAAAVAHDGPIPATYLKKIRRDAQQYAWHSHPVAQLLAVEAGSVVLQCDHGAFVIPRGRAVWIPPQAPHAVRPLSAAELRAVLLDPGRCGGLPPHACSMAVTPLLGELLKAFAQAPEDYPADSPDARLAAVILDQVKGLAVEPLLADEMRLSDSTELSNFLEDTLQSPAHPPSPEPVARRMRISVRTLERRIAAETGMTLRAFRQRALAQKSVELLTRGLPVSAVADQLGYQEPSAFIAMFKRSFGVPPGRYAQALRREGKPH